MIIYTKRINSSGRKVYKKKNIIEKFLYFFDKYESIFTTISALLIFVTLFIFSAAYGNPVSQIA